MYLHFFNSFLVFMIVGLVGEAVVIAEVFRLLIPPLFLSPDNRCWYFWGWRIVEDLKIEIERAWWMVKGVLQMVMAVRRLLARETQIGNLKWSEDTLMILRTSERLCWALWVLLGWAGGSTMWLWLGIRLWREDGRRRRESLYRPHKNSFRGVRRIC